MYPKCDELQRRTHHKAEYLLVRIHSLALSTTSTEIIIEIFIRFYGVDQVFVAQRCALCDGQGVSHADCVLDLHTMLEKRVWNQ